MIITETVTAISVQQLQINVLTHAIVVAIMHVMLFFSENGRLCDLF